MRLLRKTGVRLVYQEVITRTRLLGRRKQKGTSEMHSVVAWFFISCSTLCGHSSIPKALHILPSPWMCVLAQLCQKNDLLMEMPFQEEKLGALFASLMNLYLCDRGGFVSWANHTPAGWAGVGVCSSMVIFNTACQTWINWPRSWK